MLGAKKYSFRPICFTYLMIAILLGCFWAGILYPFISNDSTSAKLMFELKLLLTGVATMVAIWLREKKQGGLEKKESVENGR